VEKWSETEMCEAQVIHLRQVRAEDEAFLFALFRTSREAEFAPLPQAQREALLRFQYQAQGRDYTARFPRSEDFIIECCGQMAGRLLLNREANELRVVDIAIVPELQRRGIASSVLKSLMSEAEATRIALRLSVWHNNPALALYQRLGFRQRTGSATHVELEWRSGS
jgi:ribosomal protein S18 acetylase RimI-like enzyme